MNNKIINKKNEWGHPWTESLLKDLKEASHNTIVGETTYEKGDIKYFDDISETNSFTHNLENIGETTLIFTTVEFIKISTGLYRFISII